MRPLGEIIATDRKSLESAHMQLGPRHQAVLIAVILSVPTSTLHLAAQDDGSYKCCKFPVQTAKAGRQKTKAVTPHESDSKVTHRLENLEGDLATQKSLIARQEKQIEELKHALEQNRFELQQQQESLRTSLLRSPPQTETQKRLLTRSVARSPTSRTAGQVQLRPSKKPGKLPAISNIPASCATKASHSL